MMPPLSSGDVALAFRAPLVLASRFAHLCGTAAPLLQLGTEIECGVASQSIPVPNCNSGADYLVPD